MCDLEPGESEGLCRTLCDDDSDCENKSCNPYSGECNLYNQWPHGAGLNEPCRGDDDCSSDQCDPAARVCLTACDPAYQRCPDNALCIDGVCRNACRIPRDCAADQSCVHGEAGLYCSADDA
jgi:hypothetical protein